MSVQPDGKVVLAGLSEVADGVQDLALARLDINGALDVTFDGDGRMRQHLLPSSAEWILDLALQDDGKLVALAGYGSDYRVARFHAGLQHVPAAANAPLDVLDNDVAGVTIVPSGGATQVTEGGATDNYTVVLNTQPAADVTITLAAGSQLNVSPASLVFTAGNWNVAQTVTVTAVNDAVAEGPHSGTISHSATSTDASYQGISIVSVTAQITDNDTASFAIAPAGGLTTTEAGGTATFTVQLTSQPTANVTLGLSSSDLTEGTVSPGSLIFTSGNWNTPQTVTVTGVNDDLADGNVAYLIVTAAATSSDAELRRAEPGRRDGNQQRQRCGGVHDQSDQWPADHRRRRDGGVHGPADQPADRQRHDRDFVQRHHRRHGLARFADLYHQQLEHAANRYGNRRVR